MLCGAGEGISVVATFFLAKACGVWGAGAAGASVRVCAGALVLSWGWVGGGVGRS